MQPLGGRKSRQKDTKSRRRAGPFGTREQARNADSTSRIWLRTSASWRGSSQKFGTRRRAARNWLDGLRLPARARVAAALFLGATAIYGVVLGGYVQRSADYLSRKTTSVVVRAGLAIERLTIEGQNRTSDQEIVRALNIGSRPSMLSFDTVAAQARLQKLPWVKHAQVMRLLPSRLHIVIRERDPFALWQRNGETKLIDADGTPIAPVKAETYPHLPLVVGDGAANEAKALFDLLAAEPELKVKVHAAVRVADRRWNLKLANGVEIQLPEENVSYAIGKVHALDAKHDLLSGDIAAVDLRIPGRVTIRLSKQAVARRDAVFSRPKQVTTAPGRDT